MLSSVRRLRAAGVVGINQRNRDYVMAHNPRALYDLVDDKVRTKQLASDAGIAVPQMYGLVTTPHGAREFEKLLGEHTDFVIKPAHGSGGNGIMVCVDRRRGLFIRADGTGIEAGEVEHHIDNILGGAYSLGGQPDQAIIEYRVKFDPVFDPISYRGVPDIRVLVYRGVPAMAMLRLPTRASGGRANLHQGAVGVGIDMRSGTTTHAVRYDRQISEHPDFGSPLADRVIPGWGELMLLAARCQDLAPLGYLGVDVVLDQELGPLVLELNARPGLAIQIANGRGLGKVLGAIDALEIPKDATERVQLSAAVAAQA